jgi:glycyl-tRNA synthetase beta chain
MRFMATSADSAGDLLVELGTEELPDRFLESALERLPRAVASVLQRERLEHGRVRVLGTPRRIAILVDHLASRQPDEVKELTGPPERVAVDPETGAFTKAAIRFGERYGVASDDLRLVDAPKGRVVGVTTRIEGRPAGEVVASILPELFSEKTLPYPQSMFWESHTGPFIRPVHWLVVIHGEQVVDAELFGVHSGRTSRGHRFHSSGPVEIEDAGGYEEALEKQHVLVNQDRRREVLLASLDECVSATGAELVPDGELLDEVVALTELPVPVAGGFDERFLELPEQVVITAMAVHQRYFALRDPGGGRLRPAFVAVSNTRPSDPDVVRRGYERVLAARLEDARFCYEEDLKTRLSDLRAGLQGVVFQRGLGTYLDKAGRLEQLAPAVARIVGASGAGEEDLRLAASLCKADLLTKVVYEFPELQGIMGGVYAEREGLSDDVSASIRDHYRPEGPADDLPASVPGMILALADKLDTLTGFFGMGRAPKGGSDPFGLRRACLGVVRILLEMESPAPVTALLTESHRLLAGQELKLSYEEMESKFLDFLEGRLRVLWGDEARADLLDACLACGVDSVLRARRRLEALVEFKKTEEFEDLAVAFKRAYRIVKKESDVPPSVDPTLFEQDEEHGLLEAVEDVENRVGDSVTSGEFTNAFNHFRVLRAPVDAYFEKVFVNVDDSAVRLNRLALLARIVRMIEPAARLDLVQFEKTRL